MIAGLGLMVIGAAAPSHRPTIAAPYILNVFVEPEHRRNGLASGCAASPREGPRTRRLLSSHSTRQGCRVRSLGWVDERDGIGWSKCKGRTNASSVLWGKFVGWGAQR